MTVNITPEELAALKAAQAEKDRRDAEAEDRRQPPGQAVRQDPSETPEDLDAIAQRMYGSSRADAELSERAQRMFGTSQAAVYDTYVDGAAQWLAAPPDDSEDLDSIGRRMFRR